MYLLVFVYQLSSYFLMGLYLDAGRFFSYSIIMICLTFAANGFFRFFGVITNSFVIANQASCLIFIAYMLYMGYFISYNAMHPWFFWYVLILNFYL